MTRSTPGRRLRHLAATGAAVGMLTAGLSLTLGAASSGPASADALCDQMRAQYGPDWPCINVPTYTPPPTPNEPPPMAPGETGAPGSGPNIGGSPGLGPGEGNGTPIVPGPGQGQVPQVPGRQTTPAEVNTSPTAPEVPGRTQAPATVDPGSTDSDPDPVFQPLPGSDNPSDPDTGGIPTPAWLLLGTAALVAGAPRSLLRRGGSTRGQIGPSRMVLIHDETSPNTYRFTMDVPEGGYTKVNPDGSATVYDKDGNAIRHVRRPWAFDAAGRPQKTWYEVDENGDLIQHVEPADNALYPILADPTDADPGSLGLSEALGKQEGDSWETELPDGGTIVNTIPSGNGDQSVEQVIKDSNGNVTSTQLVASNGQGGYQRWANNSDGTSAYRSRLTADSDIYGSSWDAGANPATDAPASVYGQSADMRKSETVYNNDDGTTTVVRSSQMENGEWQQSTRRPDGSVVFTKSGPSGENTVVTGELQPDGTGWWLTEDGTHVEQKEPDGHLFVTPKGGTTVERWEEDGKVVIRYPQSGRTIWSVENPDGTVTEVFKDSHGREYGNRTINPDGSGRGQMLLNGKMTDVEYTADGSIRYRMENGIDYVLKENGDRIVIDHGDNRSFYYRQGEDEPFQKKKADGSDLGMADGAHDTVVGTGRAIRDIAKYQIWNPMADAAGLNGFAGMARAQDRSSMMKNSGEWATSLAHGAELGPQWAGYDYGPVMGDITTAGIVKGFIRPDDWKQGGVTYWAGGFVADQSMGVVIPGPMDDIANASRRSIIPIIRKDLPRLKDMPTNPTSPFHLPNNEGSLFTKSTGKLDLNRAYEMWLVGNRDFTPHLVKPDGPSNTKHGQTKKFDHHVPPLDIATDFKGLQNLPPARGADPTPFQQRVIYPDIAKNIRDQLNTIRPNLGPDGSLAIVTNDWYLTEILGSQFQAAIRTGELLVLSPSEYFDILRTAGIGTPFAHLSFPDFIESLL